MSAEQLSFDPYFLAKIYPGSLIPYAPGKKAKEQTFRYLGRNKRNILVIVHNENDAFLDELSSGLLANILQACRLNAAEDVAVLNAARYPGAGWEAIAAFFLPQAVIYFGDISPALQPQPLDRYTVTLYQGIGLLQADQLILLNDNKSQKQLLWKSLQQLFHLQ